MGAHLRATRPARTLYLRRKRVSLMSTRGELVSVSYRSGIGWWGYVRGVCAPPKLLAKAKSAENERRHEARPGPTARRILRLPLRAVCFLGAPWQVLVFALAYPGQCENHWNVTTITDLHFQTAAGHHSPNQSLETSTVWFCVFKLRSENAVGR